MRYINGVDLLTALDEAEAGPEPDDLQGAPIIENWFLIWRDGDVVRADGDVHGHPTIDDPWVTTSPVLGYDYDFDREEGWLRSISRWYRLGRLREVPVNSTSPDQARRDALSAAKRHIARQRSDWRDQYGPSR
ncbi:hypothetical protein HCZ30_05600 [Marivivens donghaensis]|uniref:Uncharacterized protein n=1 Tax=Marivivens donghaensis TaxID=1699413 RepID=A0ABX0VZ37_9RHOB|nr:DUF6634 family protein [Marivivens donghaensis]NIY71908.1 hypothetical protein [Marivivens donghaensis]